MHKIFTQNIFKMKTLSEIKTIAVAGAGTMGAGIAQVAAQVGFNVLLFDVADADRKSVV